MSSESSPFPGPPIIFSTKDALGNSVEFHAHTWMHILDGHPEMAAYQHLIEPCVVDPAAIRESTDSKLALVFENTVDGFPPEDLLRVILKYKQYGFMTGDSTGFVASAFPVDSSKFRQPKVGAIRYCRTSNGREVKR